MIVPVVVEGQSLRWYGRIPEIADNSIEFVQLEFRFPEDWDSMVIVAQFTQTKTYNCLLVDNRCFLPMELVAGPCEVSVFGYLNEEVTRGTTIPLKLNISRSGFVSSAETPIPPTPDLYAQLIEYFSSIAGSGGGGSGSGTINPEDIAAAVEDYLSKNPPDVDLTGYATEQFVRDGYQPKGEYLTEVPEGYAKTTDIPTKPEDIGALPNTYTPPNQTAEQVGADPKGTAASAVSQHNTADDSHNDIRLELKALSDRLTAFFDSDDQTLDELSEIVAYITSNKSLIDSITTSKVSVADIINNLTTNVSNKPLSAAQGVVLKGLIDTVSGNLANYQPKGDYALRSEVPTVPTNVSAFTNDAGYLTGDDKDEIIAEVATDETLIDTVAEKVKVEVPLVKTAEQPTFVDSVEKMTDTSKVYVLTTDMHFYVYRKVDKNFEKTLTAEDYGIGNMSVNGLPSTGKQRVYTTELLPLADGNTISISRTSPYDFLVYFYNTDNPTETDGGTLSSSLTGKTTWNTASVDDVRKVTCTTGTMAGATHFRVAIRNHDSNTDIGTIEAVLSGITITHKSQGEVIEWVDTGFSYSQPADYEDRIVALENAYGGLEYGTY